MQNYKVKPEILFKAMCKANNLPEPVTEYQFAKPRKWRFDYAFIGIDMKIAIEVEGGVFTRGAHVRPLHFISDMEKYNTATILGWSLLRVTPDNLCKTKTIEMIKSIIGNRINE